jgi:exonuclease SbcD
VNSSAKPLTRIVHTADWHLGARLIDHDRLPEQKAFLDWLFTQLDQLRPDLLIVAGDIFDVASPPQEALNLYYNFLSRLKPLGCHTLILGGNHDSPATLQAPQAVLRSIAVTVVASPPTHPTEAILDLPHVVVCAVPYLRERDVRTAIPGQTADQVADAIRLGITDHYRRMFLLAQATAQGRPIIGTGHLTAVGSDASSSERTIHIGNLGAIDARCFDGFSYTALGHIHRPQSVGGNDFVRYAGSPICLGFDEVGIDKQIRVIEVQGGAISQLELPIPVFRSLLRITSSAATLASDLAPHQSAPNDPLEPWIELTVSDCQAHPDIARQVRDATKTLTLEVLKIIPPQRAIDALLTEDPAVSPSLGDLQPEEVFAARLRREPIDKDSPEGQALVATFTELMSGLHDFEVIPNPEAAR